MRRAGLFRFSTILLVAAFWAVACGSEPVGEDANDRAVPSGLLSGACRTFSNAWGQEDLDEAANALREMANAIVSSFPDEAQLTLTAATELETDGAVALGRLGPLIPILAGEACAGAQELLSGYVPTPAPDTDAVLADLASGMGRWANANIATYHYETFFHQELEGAASPRCGIGANLVVQVVDGVPNMARDQFSGCEIQLADPNRPPLTVEEWFSHIESLISTLSELRELNVTFSDIGVPLEFFIASDRGWVEGGISNLTEGLANNKGAEKILTDLEQARQVWTANGPDSYSYQVEVRCFCPEEYRGPFTVVVRDDVVESTHDGEQVSEFAPTEYFTVSGLFDAVEAFAFSDSIIVSYDVDFGFPALIDADPVANAIDEEQEILVTQFAVES